MKLTAFPATPEFRERRWIVIGATEGLEHDSAVSLDHVQCVDRARLIRRLGRLSPERMREVCSALAVATGCD